MALEFLTDEHLEKITRAAILLNEEGVVPTDEVIEDEEVVHLPQLIAHFAAMRGLFWTTLEGGVRLLKTERELDEEQFDAPHDVRKRKAQGVTGGQEEEA